MLMLYLRKCTGEGKEWWRGGQEAMQSDIFPSWPWLHKESPLVGTYLATRGIRTSCSGHQTGRGEGMDLPSFLQGFSNLISQFFFPQRVNSLMVPDGDLQLHYLGSQTPTHCASFYLSLKWLENTDLGCLAVAGSPGESLALLGEGCSPLGSK